MTPLIGMYFAALDEKKRVAIPSRSRPAFGEGQVTLIRGPRGSISCYPAAASEDYFARSTGLNLIPEHNERRRLKQNLMAKSWVEHMDSEGRIYLTKELREHAASEDVVLLVGMIGHLEIWNPKRFKDMEDRA